MRALVLTAAWLSIVGATAQGAEGYLSGEPLHQSGCYKIDFDPARTWRIIRDGHGAIEITRIPAEDGSVDASTFDALVQSTLHVLQLGEQSLQVAISFPNSYFTPSFMPGLREQGSFTAPSFTMKHLGRATTETVDGDVYEDTDVVAMTDIKTKPLPGSDDGLAWRLNDVTMRAHVHPTVPGIGAAKVDISGDVGGARFKIGLDYTLDASRCNAREMP